MKKITNFALMSIILVALIFALAACNDAVAPLAQPEDDGIVLVPDSAPDYAEYDAEEGLYDDEWFDMAEGPIQVTGEVVSIETTGFGDQVIQITGDDGTTNLVTYFNTFFLGDTPEVGDTITGYFILEPFMMAIYPPQHNVSVIVNSSFQDDGLPFIHVCRFMPRDGESFGDNDQLVSLDGELVINLGGENTVITLQNGDDFDGELAGRMLVVTYAMATFSIPPQTTPIEIIVLYERAVTGPESIELPDGWEYDFDFEEWYCIVIDGEGLPGAHAIFMDEDSYFQTHVELVPVAEFLGAEVEWNQDTNEVTLEGRTGSISFVVGAYDFTVNGETVTLLQPSVDFYGSLYVPVLFFRDVFGMPSAFSFEGRIYINSEECDMQ